MRTLIHDMKRSCISKENPKIAKGIPTYTTVPKIMAGLEIATILVAYAPEM